MNNIYSVHITKGLKNLKLLACLNANGLPVSIKGETCLLCQGVLFCVREIWVKAMRFFRVGIVNVFDLMIASNVISIRRNDIKVLWCHS